MRDICFSHVGLAATGEIEDGTSDKGLSNSVTCFGCLMFSLLILVVLFVVLPVMS